MTSEDRVASGEHVSGPAAEEYRRVLRGRRRDGFNCS